MPPLRTDEREEEEERFPALHPGTREAHLRRVARLMTPDLSRQSRLIGAQYLYLAVLVGVLLLVGPRMRLRLPRELWWLVPLYVIGGWSLLRNRHRRR